MATDKTPKEHYVIRKSNALIESRSHLTVAEQRVLFVLIACIQPDDTELGTYRFAVSELASLFGFEKNNRVYQRVRDTLKRLHNRGVTIKHANGNWEMYHWLSFIKYYDGEGSFELKIGEGLHPYLLELKSQYKAYQLGNLIQLKSKYSVRLYELLKQYEKIGKRYFELEELRLALGIEEGEYPKSKDFKNRVLEPAQKELPKKTDLKFTYQRRMRARRIVGYDFKITTSKTAPTAVAKSRMPQKSDSQQTLAFPPTVIERSGFEQREGLTAIGDILANLS
jgi:plasmid replication initiation protein